MIELQIFNLAVQPHLHKADVGSSALQLVGVLVALLPTVKCCRSGGLLVQKPIKSTTAEHSTNVHKCTSAPILATLCWWLVPLLN